MTDPREQRTGHHPVEKKQSTRDTRQEPCKQGQEYGLTKGEPSHGEDKREENPEKDGGKGDEWREHREDGQDKGETQEEPQDQETGPREDPHH